jgi:ethanolamine ammonia-lyase small subunit
MAASCKPQPVSAPAVGYHIMDQSTTKRLTVEEATIIELYECNAMLELNLQDSHFATEVITILSRDIPARVLVWRKGSKDIKLHVVWGSGPEPARRPSGDTVSNR